ncbi:MAG: hypothetical protein ACREJ4_13190 [Candidatus Methylomirabilaceae bacterium]
MANAVLPAQVPSPFLAILRQSPLRLERQNGLVVLSGDPAVFRLGLCVAADRALAGDSVLYLDGANVFDPFLIGRLARAGGAAPNAVLGRIHVSRAFTCHQMARLVTERLAGALRTSHARLIILSGPLETFYDEAVPYQEVAGLLHRILATLRHLAHLGHRLLCLSPVPPPEAKGRDSLLKTLSAQANRLIWVEATEAGVSLREICASAPRSWLISRATWECL